MNLSMFSTSYLKKLKIYLVAAIVIFFLSSCKKTSQIPGTNPKKKPVTYVYVVGDTYTSKDVSVATYWKNSVSHLLVTDTTKSSLANGIAIKDTDVYICGAINGVATYWKNGLPVSVANNAIATGIFINGSDIYLIGETFLNGHDVATLWKNGIATILPDASPMSNASSIFVNGNDVYIAGLSEPTFGDPYLVYWKNGVESQVSHSESQPSTISIAVNGSDLYLTGSSSYGNSAITQATYWKNGVPTILYNSVLNGVASANVISIKDGNIYIAGSSNNKAAYWINGIEHDLTSSSLEYITTGLALSGTDIYTAGYSVNNNLLNAIYWKNDTMIVLSTRLSYANGISIVQF